MFYVGLLCFIAFTGALVIIEVSIAFTTSHFGWTDDYVVDTRCSNAVHSNINMFVWFCWTEKKNQLYTLALKFDLSMFTSFTTRCSFDAGSFWRLNLFPNNNNLLRMEASLLEMSLVHKAQAIRHL